MIHTNAVYCRNFCFVQVAAQWCVKATKSPRQPLCEVSAPSQTCQRHASTRTHNDFRAVSKAHSSTIGT